VVELESARAMGLRVEEKRKKRKKSPRKNIDIIILAILAIIALFVFVWVYQGSNHGAFWNMFRRPGE
jgi:hypothetical protein